jgi:tetratricopeptide (TPR) repeat protein
MAQAFCDWRWHDAESHFLKAIERDSYSGAGHLWRAIACLIPTGKMEEAIAELQQARELAPAPFFDEAHILALYFSGNLDTVLQLTQRVEASAMPIWRQWLRGCALAALGRTEEAADLFAANPDDSRMLAGYGYVSGLAGDQDKALEALAQLTDRRSRGTWVSQYDLAMIQTAMGNRTDAMALLQEALREKEPWMAFLAVDPRLAPLRSMPKFEGLVRRIQLTDSDARENTNFMRESAS